jgi:hypothetical protein
VETKVATATIETASGAGRVRPYAPSWIDRLFDVMSALPGPTWLAYAVLVVPGVALANSALWLSGLRPWGSLDPSQVFWGAASVMIVAAAHHLRDLAGESFDRFRPALGSGAESPEAARYALTVMPAIPVAILSAAIFLLIPVYYAWDPVASQVVGLVGAGIVARVLAEGIGSVVFVSVAYQALRQLRIVTRLHAVADQLDPFRPHALYAFSRLTAQVAIVLVVFISAVVVVDPQAIQSTSNGALWLPWLIGTPLVASVVFAVPLLGIHGRLDAEKRRLETAADGRLRALLGELDEAIDARATERVDALDRTLTALRNERDVLARLPTWPFSASTIRGLGPALLLPIVVFLIQRYLGAALGG